MEGAKESSGLRGVVEGLTQVLPRRAFQQKVGANLVRGAVRIARWRADEVRLESIGVQEGWAGA